MGMKALVIGKRAVDYAVKVRVANKVVDITGAKMSINPFCEIAVEEAIRLKQKKVIKEITVCTVGPSGAKDMLRSALAMGADKAVHFKIDDDKRTDTFVQPINVANIINNYLKENKFDIILMGKQSIDADH